MGLGTDFLIKALKTIGHVQGEIESIKQNAKIAKEKSVLEIEKYNLKIFNEDKNLFERINSQKIFIAPYGQTTTEDINQLKNLFYNNNLNPYFIESLSFVDERRQGKEERSQIDNKEKKEILNSDLFILIVSKAGHGGYTSHPNWLHPFYFAEEQGIPIVCVYTAPLTDKSIMNNGSMSMTALKKSLALWVDMKEEKVMWACSHWPERHKLYTLERENSKILLTFRKY